MSSKYLIYTCCFHQEVYTEILSYLINSFKQTNSAIDFLIYTTGEFKTLIETKCPDSGVKFFEKNFYKSMNQARISKLDIFDYPEIDNYEKVVYIDADSFFVKDPAPMFDAIQDNVVYVVGEGNILHDAEYWGRSLFTKENPQYGDREGLSSCVMGFKNIPEIKKMFIKTKQAFYLDMYQNRLKFYDQPFLNFYFIHNNMCNTEAFKQFVKSRQSAEVALKEGLSIVHFAGCPGHGNVKLDLVKEFQTDYNRVFIKKVNESLVNESLVNESLPVNSLSTNESLVNESLVNESLPVNSLSAKDQTIFLLQQQMKEMQKQMELLLSSQ